MMERYLAGRRSRGRTGDGPQEGHDQRAVIPILFTRPARRRGSRNCWISSSTRAPARFEGLKRKLITGEGEAVKEEAIDPKTGRPALRPG